MNRFLVLVGEWETRLRAEHGTQVYTAAEVDQIRAASDETDPLMLEHAFRMLDRDPDARYNETTGVVMHRAAAMIMASFHMPGMRRCEHTVRAQPLLALMPLRVVVCRACAGYERDLPSVIPDDRCDWCEEVVTDRRFVPVTVRYNHLTAVGDACTGCAPEFWAAYGLEGQPGGW